MRRALLPPGAWTRPVAEVAFQAPHARIAGFLERLLTTHEVAELLKLHVKTVERMARAGRLPSLRVAGRRRFRPSDIASWLAEREDRPCHGC
jgi:excisionase family DNA binding protein